MRALSGRRAVAALGLVLAAPLCGCATSPWSRYEASLYRALREPSPEAYGEHAALLEAVVREAETAGRRPPPGICAECAFYLARVGRPDAGRAYLEKERRHYPESGKLVSVVEGFLAGEDRAVDESGDPGGPE